MFTKTIDKRFRTNSDLGRMVVNDNSEKYKVHQIIIHANQSKDVVGRYILANLMPIWSTGNQFFSLFYFQQRAQIAQHILKSFQEHSDWKVPLESSWMVPQIS